MIISTKMLKYNCNKEIGKEVITMSLYGNYYPDNADLTFDQMNKIEGHYQMIADECEDRVKQEYLTYTAQLKSGKKLSGDDLGELLVSDTDEDDLSLLVPVLNDVYKSEPEEFNSYGIHNGLDLGNFIVNKSSYLRYPDYQYFCSLIAESDLDLHDYPQVFKTFYDLNDKADLQELAEQEYKDGNY